MVKRILLADRDPQVRHSCLTALTRGNYKAEVCEDGESAWRILLKQNFDLLIVSQDMPRLSGMALIRQLRLAEINLLVVLIAQNAIADQISHDPWHRIAAILSRPFTTEELLRVSNEVLTLEQRPPPYSASESSEG